MQDQLLIQLSDVEQWGYKFHNNTHQSIVTLPIPFASSGYVGVANDSGTVTIGIAANDKNSIVLRDNNSGGQTKIFWLIIGH